MISMNKILLFILFNLLLLPTLKSQNGFQYWNEVESNYNLNKKLKLIFGSEQKFYNNATYLGMYNLKFGANYKFTDHFNFSLFYKYEPEFIKKDTITVRIDEHRIEFIPIVEFKLSNVKFKIYNRIELRDIEDKLSWRWRPGIKIKKELKINSFAFSPYIYEDFFYSLTKGEFNQNRLYGGIEKKLSKKFDMAFYYMLLSKRSKGEWNNINTVGTYLLYKIN